MTDAVMLFAFILLNCIVALCILLFCCAAAGVSSHTGVLDETGATQSSPARRVAIR